jgi:hypothetical protein
MGIDQIGVEYVALVILDQQEYGVERAVIPIP